MTIRKIATLTVLLALFMLVAATVLTSSAANAADQASQRVWQDVNESSIAQEAARQIIPNRYRTVAADLAALDSLLASAPAENTADRTAGVLLSLPLPDGTFGRFLIQEYAMMEPALAAKFPEIKTYLGQGVDDPTATVRLDRTPAGFHGMILSASDTIYIDPYRRGDVTNYISYYKRDFDPATKPSMAEMMEFDADAISRLPNLTEVMLPPSGSQLRTYRTAVAATGEYTQFHGGTVAAGLAAIVTSINRVTGVYEREVAVRLVLVANNNLIVYTNAATDPYTNNNGSTMLGQNQTNLDAVIGSANYDIGHVFSTGGGGVASLGVPCRAGLKARGVTGSSQPVGDPFDIDYVAHEMGHQFGGNHTFNGTTSSCGGGNRNASTAYEPGSASSIMGYAGICGAEDLQPHSDDVFHVISFDEIVAYTTTGQGNTCAAITNTGNTPPTVNAGSDYTIPRQTAFTLTGSTTDPNGDTLTYSWEQFNLGSAAPPNTDNGNRPIFRAFAPVTGPSRTFPQLSDILNNVSTLGESLPTTNRTLVFRLVVRDNRAGGGGVNYDTANVVVTTSSGPFVVTAPNTAVTWPGGSTQAVTWNVASTNLAPVSCSAVNILLSTDGGLTFPTALASSTANDGSESITVPNVSTTTARVKVECAGNIFFDISNANFTITSGGPTATPTATSLATATPTATNPAPATPTATATATATPGSGGGSTGYRSPTAHQATTDGDKNGYEVNPTNAFADDGLFALDNDSGTATGTACTSAGKDRHRFYNYGFPLPGGATINGIEVRLDARADSTAGGPKLCVQLSWDGGTSWTAAQSTTTLNTAETTYILGGPADTWGRTWTTAELSNANFRLRITDVSSDLTRDFSLDWAAVNVTYNGGGGATATPTATTVPPTATNTPTATPVLPTATSTATPTATNTPSANTMHVGDLDGSSVPNSTRWDATVLITIHDSSENPVANATVTGAWSNGGSGSSNCVTNGSGQCSVSKTKLTGASVTFTVTNVTHASKIYQSGSNHDPDGDSNGTVIVVLRP